jgi:hypothetical protein
VEKAPGKRTSFISLELPRLLSHNHDKNKRSRKFGLLHLLEDIGEVVDPPLKGLEQAIDLNAFASRIAFL